MASPFCIKGVYARMLTIDQVSPEIAPCRAHIQNFILRLSHTSVYLERYLEDTFFEIIFLIHIKVLCKVISRALMSKAWPQSVDPN